MTIPDGVDSFLKILQMEMEQEQEQGPALEAVQAFFAFFLLVALIRQ